jgi:3-oxoacyl-[acyl-carrier-protein] synthase II
MKISGVGVICSRGLGVAAFEQALKSGWRKPGETEAHWLAPLDRLSKSSNPADSTNSGDSMSGLTGLGGEKAPAYLVTFDALPDKTLLKKIRRADAVSKMAVLAASDALVNSGMENIAAKRLGIIVATALGPHVTTFDFLDDILDHGDAAVSPTTFSNSVHNAAASYIAMSLNIKGPTLTISQFRFSFQEALRLAQVWLDQGRCDYVLAGAVDQYGDVLGYVADHKLTTAKDGRIKPFTFNPTCQVPGEGSVFFLLGNTSEGNVYCSVSEVHANDDPGQGKSVDINIIDADGMLPDESAYLAALSNDIPTAAYSPLFGSMMIGGAFNAAAGALMLKQQTRYATPVQDNPRGIRMLTESGSGGIGSIRCIGFDCYAEKSVIYLTKA